MIISYEHIFEKIFKIRRKRLAFNNINDIRNLRDHFRVYNIYISRNGRRIAENLIIIVSIDEYYE
jgi:hypothetical protein